MKLKICGITRQEDLDCAAEAGFDACGFIFHAPSPRCVSIAQANKLDSRGMQRIGVFVNQDASQIEAIMHLAKLDFAQLHGAQSAETALRIGPERVIRVLWPERCRDMEELCADAQKLAASCAWFLLDAGKKGGGSGQSLASDLLRQIALPRPWFLAGGLGPDNVAAILSLCHPDGLDFNSGVEIQPGVKDKAKMLAVIRILRENGILPEGYAAKSKRNEEKL